MWSILNCVTNLDFSVLFLIVLVVPIKFLVNLERLIGLACLPDIKNGYDWPSGKLVLLLAAGGLSGKTWTWGSKEKEIFGWIGAILNLMGNNTL